MLEGIDVSTYQVVTPPLDGKSFLFARATYDVTPDNRYAQHAAAGRAAGLTVGAYHFGTGRATPAAQAKAFLAVAAASADLLALDLESDAVPMSTGQAAAFISAVQATGRTIGLYHSESGFPTLGQDWDWVAKWGTVPPTRTWAFWQYRGSPGDLDRFAGTQAQLDAMHAPKPGTVIALPAGTSLYAHRGDASPVGTMAVQYGLTVERSDGVWTLGHIRAWVKL